ncbi:exosome 3'-_5 exonuclease subunit ski4 (Csl4) [Ceratobasidium sp. 392]|nr:exosome 3'->5 exonuclease subunit ski4 (Csl4) [Ceratobasidium sp. 392]
MNNLLVPGRPFTGKLSGGSYTRDGVPGSSSLGYASGGSVKAASASRAPSPGAVVVGTVTRLSPLQATISITIVDSVPLPHSEESTGAIQVQDVRSTEKANGKISGCFRGGDVRSAVFQRPTSGNRHQVRLSIAGSVVSTMPKEIRERYRLSFRETPPPSAIVNRPAAFRRDSLFSAHTQWTVDKCFLESSGTIADFPLPPAMIPGHGPFVLPALPLSSNTLSHLQRGHVNLIRPHEISSPSRLLGRCILTRSRIIQTHPTCRLNNAPSMLTVRTERYLDPNTNAPIEIVSGPSSTASPASTHYPPLPTSRQASPRQPLPSLLPPLPLSRPDAFADWTRTRVPRRTAFAWHGRLFGEPVMPPSPHASHEGLLDPGFIRTLMSGIEAGSDGLDLALNSEEIGQALEDADRGGEGGPFGDRYVVEEPCYQEQDDEPQPTSAPLPPDNRGTWFRRAPPAASLPSSPRGSFSFSVRSGVDKSSGGGWQHEDAPAVPPIPALYRQAQSGSSGSPSAPVTPSSHTTSFVTTPVNGTLRPDWTLRRKSAGKETIASGSGMSTLTAGGANSGGQSHLSGITKHASTSGEEEGVDRHAALVRTASPAEMRSAVYASTPTSPQSQYTGDQRWSVIQGTGTHARTTSADSPERAVRNRRSQQQLQFSSVTHLDARRSVAGGGSGTGGSEGAGGGIVGVREEDEDDLVYVRGEDVVPGNRGLSYVAPARESSYIGGRESSYVINGRDSTYPGAWAEPPSPNGMTPALGSPHASSPMIR